jgi:hypothetical protein
MLFMKIDHRKEHPPMNSSPDAHWKDSSEQSERWKETLGKGFLPRVSPLTIQGLMLLGRKAASNASVGRKPWERVSFQEYPSPPVVYLRLLWL